MFASLFRRAEASVDNALGDLGNRVLIAIPFLVALGFAAASLASVANRVYGPDIGNLLVAVAFVALGTITAIIVKLRKKPITASDEPEPAPSEEEAISAKSPFENEQLMGMVSAAAPILLPALLRTATKNWPLILAVAAGVYVFTQSESDAPGSSGPQES